MRRSRRKDHQRLTCSLRSMSIEVEQRLAEEYISPEQLRQIVVTALPGNQVPILSLRDIVDLMRKNETSVPHFRNSNTYKRVEPPIFEN